MKKKKSGGGGANWMDTYGDMVTLLLCFFVLLYSMSTISEEKWKAIVTSFNPNAAETPTESSGNQGPIADEVPWENTGDQVIENRAQQIEDMINEIYEALQQMSQEEGMESVIAVSMEGGKVYVKFNETTFFDGDSATLKPQAIEILTRVTAVLDKASGAIEEVRVQGHTAQATAHQRNNVRKDRTLASDRATNVVIFIQEHSSDLYPGCLISEGFGQWRPISSNETAESRAYNRRVEMIISGRDAQQEFKGEGIMEYITIDGGNASTGAASSTASDPAQSAAP